MKSFSVSIVTPEKTVYQGEAVSLIVPAARGYLGILADHAPLIANLTAGKIILRKDGSQAATTFYSKGKGFLEVLKNNVILFLDFAGDN